MELSPRLKTVYEMLGEGGCIIDVGCDHGYLPIKLISDGKYSSAYMTDVAKGPLEAARENADALCKKPDRMEFFLSDGLGSVPEPGSSFSVSVCGMGGELIASIVFAAPEWVKRSDVFVFQPMSRAQALRSYLWENGFEIKEERYAAEGGHIYTVIKAVFSGRKTAYRETELYLGKRETRNNTAQTLIFLEHIRDKHESILRALEGAGKGFAAEERIVSDAEAEIEYTREKLK